MLSRALAALIALHQGITMLDLRSQTIDPEAAALLPEDIARRYQVLPVRRQEGRLNPNPPKDTDGRGEDSGRGWVRELQGRWPGGLG